MTRWDGLRILCLNILIGGCVYLPHSMPFTPTLRVQNDSVIFADLRKNILRQYSDAEGVKLYFLDVTVASAECPETCGDLRWKVSSEYGLDRLFNNEVKAGDFSKLPNEIVYGRPMPNSIVEQNPLLLSSGQLHVMDINVLAFGPSEQDVGVIRGSLMFTLTEKNGSPNIELR